MEIWTPKYIQVTSLTFWGHVTSSVTWPFDSPCGVSYRLSMVTMRLSGTVNEIFSLEDIGVTTLTLTKNHKKGEIIQHHIDTVNVMRAISPFYDFFCCFWRVSYWMPPWTSVGYKHSFIHSFLYCNKCQTHSPLHMLWLFCTLYL